MKINKKFYQMSKSEYYHYIDNHKEYTDFNTLGLYRSLLENEKLRVEEKIEIREYAHKQFLKSFMFFQLKDPITYVEVSHLGEDLTKGDEIGIWDKLKANQKKILADKRIKHRNFGVYSKHECGYEDCIYKGVMIKSGSLLEEGKIHFDGDKNGYASKEKSERIKKQRRNKSKIIQDEFDTK